MVDCFCYCLNDKYTLFILFIKNKARVIKKSKKLLLFMPIYGTQGMVKNTVKLVEFSTKLEGESATPLFPIKKSNRNKTWAWILPSIHF